MPVQDYMKLISVDDHLFEHPRVWTDRLPEKYKEVGPTVVVRDGRDCWQYEGEVETGVPRVERRWIGGEGRDIS